ncbi:hypothetical protein B0T20DRAFT_395223 [Sordaria brevicollis]|uniref:Uncharacterized protein n=1 Tax=Sordaria brevicollis TaxID=83679 RepID=A0AAE0P8H6_SORBR|nr:hypothetical protein B0T20DRAFT_395223 [Sordaria brevicollis]
MMGAAAESDVRSLATTAAGPLSRPSSPPPAGEKTESQQSSIHAMTMTPSRIRRNMTGLTTASKGPGCHWSRIEDMAGNKPQMKLEEIILQATAETPSGIRLSLVPADDGGKPYLPGQPRVYLDGSSSDPNDALPKYLVTSHLTKKTDRLLKWMKYIFVQTPSYRHIMPLHHQNAHDREIKVDEHPCLHLVWYYERIFIKPVPAYFYCQAFWEYIADANPEVYEACLGFMRSYYFLIKYEVDFELAIEKRLIPKKSNGEHPTYEEWCNFIRQFSVARDDQVSKRYEFGELRLSRLNMASFFFRGKLAFFHIWPQWGSFLTASLAPMLTIFAICSVILNSMQVSLQALDSNFDDDDRWLSLKTASIWFPIGVSLLIAAVITLALVGILVMAVLDIWTGIKTRRLKRKNRWEGGEKTHGVIW